MQKILIATSLVLLLNSVACVDDRTPKNAEEHDIDRANRLKESTSAGNLIASAVKEQYNVDVALIPSIILKEGETFQLDSGEITADTRAKLFALYDETKDTVRTGTMRGADIKDFILRRMTHYMDVDLQVAGVRYDLNMRGGWPESFVVMRDKGQPLEDDKRYRVAVSNYFYDYKSLFPGYYYGDNMSFSLAVEADGYGSIRTALDGYLRNAPAVAPLQEPRAFVTNAVVGDAGFLKISQIQGTSHLSAFRGYHVITRGVITGVGVPKGDDARNWAKFPGRELPTEIIIQDPEADNDDRTSEALSLFLPGSVTTYKVGQLIEVSGVVHETRTGGGFSGTSLRMVDDIKVVAENQPLPEPILIGAGGRMMATKKPSTFPGNLNARSVLNIDEAVDFWESLEGMRVTLKTPRVTGTRGGLKDYDAVKKGRANYVEISLVPAGMDTDADRTGNNGNFYDPYLQDFNVETVKMIDGPFSPMIDPSKLVLDVGDQFDQDLVGILNFNQNTFGDGRYVFHLTGTTQFPKKKPIPQSDSQIDFNERLANPLQNSASGSELTFATWNVENLGASDTTRIASTAKVIREVLKCPDIMTLPEIQDNNAEKIYDGSAANLTLTGIINYLNPNEKYQNCPGRAYKAINIDPIPFRDGGEYGGNIRVAMIYDSARVQFTPRGEPTAISDTYVKADGSLNQNPGRIDPLNPALDGSRKPLVAEFSFKGQRVFVIGNHFNSMLGEGSPMGAIQPYHFTTETKRTEIAGIVRRFIEVLRNRNPDVHLIVSGDFNAYHKSNSLKTLTGDFLTNMMTNERVAYPRTEWYSTNYDGNSAAIDFIFASPALMDKYSQFQILHINSPFMVKTSDHDPVVARFRF